MKIWRSTLANILYFLIPAALVFNINPNVSILIMLVCISYLKYKHLERKRDNIQD
jgi:hypothetical protein